MENYFLSLFEDLRHERSLILLLSLTDESILKESGFTDDEIKIIKNIALQKVHRQRSLKEYNAIKFLYKLMTNYNLKDQDGVYSNLMKDAALLKVKTKDDEIKELKYKAEKHDYENILKSLKIDNEFYKKKFKSLSKQKISFLY